MILVIGVQDIQIYSLQIPECFRIVQACSGRLIIELSERDPNSEVDLSNGLISTLCHEPWL